MESKGLIVDAAISILETQGYTKFSIEKVARTAGVGKQTI
ncbi:TetR/AcrR family transcriptional regulator, partial [Porticoccaceae bacterium]|nr:TetR/AcrR family transcriptional regulator [Porticoccaceae bacterium]